MDNQTATYMLTLDRGAIASKLRVIYAQAHRLMGHRSLRGGDPPAGDRADR